jgi:hypothetical protein
MSNKLNKNAQHFDHEETFGGALDGAAKFAFYGGILATLVAVALLVFTAYTFASGVPHGASADQAMANIDLLQKLLLVGIIALIVGSTYMFWGEETLPVLQLVLAGALYFAPLYVPMIIGDPAHEVAGAALGTLQTGGLAMGALALMVLVVDLSIRVKQRAKEGARADQLKYGKGIKEEKEVQNVFMGKCWQLPFCRKFVREKCPIYHARRACWKERVGCMCEEEVVRNAMENRPIPKDAVAAARYIPVNNRLTLEQKKERCRQCVIYNEHQRHKYRLWLPITVLSFVALYFLLRTPLLAASGAVITRLDRVIGALTFKEQSGVGQTVTQGAIPFQEILLVCVMIVVLAYALKGLEYVIFKLKV